MKTSNAFDKITNNERRRVAKLDTGISIRGVAIHQSNHLAKNPTHCTNRFSFLYTARRSSSRRAQLLIISVKTCLINQANPSPARLCLQDFTDLFSSSSFLNPEMSETGGETSWIARMSSPWQRKRTIHYAVLKNQHTNTASIYIYNSVSVKDEEKKKESLFAL